MPRLKKTVPVAPGANPVTTVLQSMSSAAAAPGVPDVAPSLTEANRKVESLKALIEATEAKLAAAKLTVEEAVQAHERAAADQINTAKPESSLVPVRAARRLAEDRVFEVSAGLTDLRRQLAAAEKEQAVEIAKFERIQVSDLILKRVAAADALDVALRNAGRCASFLRESAAVLSSYPKSVTHAASFAQILGEHGFVSAVYASGGRDLGQMLRLEMPLPAQTASFGWQERGRWNLFFPEVIALTPEIEPPHRWQPVVVAKTAPIPAAGADSDDAEQREFLNEIAREDQQVAATAAGGMDNAAALTYAEGLLQKARRA
ncbi:MAG: hypothetical protein ACLQME_11010 [Alphaproteobacteria bacterium]